MSRQVWNVSPGVTPLLMCSPWNCVPIAALVPGLAIVLPARETLRLPLSAIPPPAINTTPQLLYWRTWLLATVIVIEPLPCCSSESPDPSNEPEFAVAATPTVLALKLPETDPVPGSLTINTALPCASRNELLLSAIDVVPAVPPCNVTPPPPVAI